MQFGLGKSRVGASFLRPFGVIKSLSVERFKSIKELSLTCRKVNVFIGAPDTGKTNILEALYFVSRLGWGSPIDTSLRLRSDLGFDPLFYRQFFDRPIRISLTVEGPSGQTGEVFVQAAITGGMDRRLVVSTPYSSGELTFGSQMHVPQLEWVRYYAYSGSEQWSYYTGYYQGTTFITPPNGGNLLYIARHNAEVYDFLKTTVAGLNWKLKFDQAQKAFRLSEVRGDEIVEYNLDLLSDSLKRQFFYGAILQSSDNVTLVFDEPDVFAFPPFPKALGEMIGADPSNQFFLTTHNPYFLAGIIQKTPADNLALFVCFRDQDGSTRTRLLSKDEISRVVELGASVFFNLSDFLTA